MKLRTTKLLMTVLTWLCLAVILVYVLIWKIEALKYAAILVMFAEVCIVWKFWRCPHCDRGLANQKIKKDTTEITCPYCNKKVDVESIISWS